VGTFNSTDIGTDEGTGDLSIEQEIDVILNRFKEVDIGGKVHMKQKLREISYLYMRSLCAPKSKVKTKGAKKGKSSKFARSTK